MVKDKDMQFFMINMKMKRKRDKKNWPSPTGIWTPDFWTNSRPKFEFWGRSDQSSSRFLEFLNFTIYEMRFVMGQFPLNTQWGFNNDCYKYKVLLEILQPKQLYIGMQLRPDVPCMTSGTLYSAVANSSYRFFWADLVICNRSPFVGTLLGSGSEWPNYQA